jgi:hypothetical protein
MHETGGEGEVEAVGRLDRGDAARIALDVHRGAQARHPERAAEARE